MSYYVPLPALDRLLCICEGTGQSEPVLCKYHADPSESRSWSRQKISSACFHAMVIFIPGPMFFLRQ